MKSINKSYNLSENTGWMKIRNHVGDKVCRDIVNNLYINLRFMEFRLKLNREIYLLERTLEKNLFK